MARWMAIPAAMGILGMILTGGGASALTDCEKREGFVSLFDGQTLSGWTIMGDASWSVQSGMIVCSGKGGGWLRSNNKYRDFILRLDYRIGDGGNSGLFLRATEQGNPAFTGLELQILGDHGGPPSKHSTASVYDAIAPSANLSRPGGEWNSYEVIYIGNTLTVLLNGRVVVMADLFDKALNESLAEERRFWNRAPEGYIGFQNHGAKVEFRDIRIRPLTLHTPPPNP